MKLLLADDDILVTEGLKVLLESEKDINIVGVASNGQEAIALCKQLQPDIILMDVRMPIMDGVLATKQIKEQFKYIKVLILTTFKDDEYIKQAIKNGAEGYILKTSEIEAVVENLRAINKGAYVFGSEVFESLNQQIQKQPTKKSPSEWGLTKRDLTVLKLIAEGLSNQEIGNTLYLSNGSVRNRVTSLLDKLELRDRTQLAIFYLKEIEV